MNIDELQNSIDGAVKRAELIAMDKLKAANNLVDDIKLQMAHGTDMIMTSQIQEWAIVVPLICKDLTPAKEAFALTYKLWGIEISQIEAKNLLELDKKKTEIDRLNKVAGTEGERRKAYSEYVRNMLGGTQDALQQLGNALRKILDARTANREDK